MTDNILHQRIYICRLWKRSCKYKAYIILHTTFNININNILLEQGYENIKY